MPEEKKDSLYIKFDPVLDEPTENYFLDLYGTCQMQKCLCLDLMNKGKMPWLGRGCSNWKPLGVRSHKELFEFRMKG